MTSPSDPEKPFIDWVKSAAQIIIITDLEKGILSCEEGELSAQDAQECCYKHIVAFKLVPFCQFREQLWDHCKQYKFRVGKSQEEAEALVHDRQLHPRQPYNLRGEPVFDMSLAKKKLREDVKNNKHTTMSPSMLQDTRPEYRQFHPKKFKERIYQEIRLQKFYNHLNLKRQKQNNIVGAAAATIADQAFIDFDMLDDEEEYEEEEEEWVSTFVLVI